VDLALPLAMLGLGFVSSVHCAGMCGGIVASFTAQKTIFPKRVLWRRQVLLNAGRVSTYAMAGALAGSAGGLAAYTAAALPLQTVLYAVANIVLILVGLHLAGVGAGLARLEALGAPLWRRLRPLAARLLPARSLSGVYAAGLVWGCLPCGLVYGALAVAAASSSLSGSPAQGAAAMLAFGLGTLPALMSAGLAAARVRAWMSRRPVRIAAGSSVLAFGAYGLAHAGGIAEGVRRGIMLCL
jgi:uncharacterized protein